MKRFVLVAAIAVGLTVQAAAEMSLLSTNQLVEAAEYNDFDLVRSLLARGRDPDSADSLGRTPLIIAANAGNEDMVELILKHGANDGSAHVRSHAKGAKPVQVLMVGSSEPIWTEERMLKNPKKRK